MKPTIGRIVLYTLAADDAEKINRRRTTGASIAERIKSALWPIGAQAHIGNVVSVGEVFPMIVVRVWDADSVNGQVMLDGNDTFWALTAIEGTGPGSWAWPPRA